MRAGKEVLWKIMAFLQVPRFWRYLHRHEIIILMYHGFTDQTSFLGIENYQGKHLNVKTFRNQLRYLSSHYSVISLDKVVEHYATGKELPKYPLVITIDDGYKSTFTHAYPMLSEFELPAAVFVATDFVDKKEPMWTDRVDYALNEARPATVTANVGGFAQRIAVRNTPEKLASANEIRSVLKSGSQELIQDVVKDLERQSGSKLSFHDNTPRIYAPLEWNEVVEMLTGGLISIGSHTKSHYILSKCTPDAAWEELTASKQIIEEKTGTNCDTFCYPNGGTRDFNKQTGKQLQEAGYRCALTTVEGFNGRDADVMELKRILCTVDGSEFALAISGFRLFCGRVKESWRRILKIGR